MKASTTFASLAAAASLVGVIGIAYAQSDSGSQGGGVAQTPQQTQMAPAPGTTTPDSSMNNSASPSGSTMAPSTNDTLANTPEPAPQADRN